ncbi:MAG: AAA family ATPase [Desulfotalea sp.]
MLKQLEINNFKSIDNVVLNLTPLTIFTGANSSGKSTVLQAIMLLIKESTPGNVFSMEEQLNYLDNFFTIRNKKTNAKKINIKAIDDKNNAHSVEITADNTEVSSNLPYQFEKSNNTEEAELLYLNANRAGAQELVPASRRRVGSIGQYLFSHFDKIKGNPLSDDMARFEGSKTIAYQLSQWLTLVTDSAIELVTEQVGDQVKVAFKVSDIDKHVSPFNLGAGISYIAKVLIICLMAKKGDLILLENPEVQLHPKSQAKLGVFLSFIASRGIQLIVETHCEHLINRVRVEINTEQINNDDVVIHYKPSSEEPFQTLFLDINGHFVDQDEKRQSFPKDFFDTSVGALLSLR